MSALQIQTTRYNTGASLSGPSAGRVILNDELELGEGDGAFVEGGKERALLGLRNDSDKEVEILVFDLASD